MPTVPFGTTCIPASSMLRCSSPSSKLLCVTVSDPSSSCSTAIPPAKIVADYVQSLKGRLELHFLPGYAPDLNPDEFVLNLLRENGVTKKPLKQNEKLKDRVETDLAQIKRSPRLVRSFFRAESVGYIIDYVAANRDSTTSAPPAHRTPTTFKSPLE